MPMRMRLAKYLLAPAVLLLLAACARTPQPDPRPEGALRVRMDTKALSGGERTFRVALFTGERNYTGREGAYCSSTYTYSAGGYTWLQPCRVNDAGEPLDDGGSVVSDLALADHGSAYGLRWNTGAMMEDPARPVELVALSPGLAVHTSGASDQYAYVDWHVGTERLADAMYVSESVPGSFSGSWIDREYVYDSDASLSGSMKDPRAAVRVKIVCGRLDEGDVRSVSVSNRLTGARFYLEGKDDIPRGFYLDDESTYTTDSRTLYTCPAGSPMHITTDPATEWTSEEVLFPAMAYSALPDTKRPVVTVVLGAAFLEVPFTARVALNQDLEPMKEYTYTLQISKTYVYVYFAPTLSWDAGGNIQSVDDAEPVCLGAVEFTGGWDDGGGGSALGWE